MIFLSCIHVDSAINYLARSADAYSIMISKFEVLSRVYLELSSTFKSNKNKMFLNE